MLKSITSQPQLAKAKATALYTIREPRGVIRETVQREQEIHAPCRLWNLPDSPYARTPISCEPARASQWHLGQRYESGGV